jgi:group I intron endonuclease
MFNGVIYCSISPSNKKYYGYTIDFEKRKLAHKNLAANGKRNKFYNAIRKYGFDNFEWSVIEIYNKNNKKDLKHILCEREIFWIDKDNTTDIGYNITEGGGGQLGNFHTEKTKEKIRLKNSGSSHPNFGKKHSKETIEKNRLSNLGKIVSIETRKKLSEQLKGKPHNLKERKCPRCGKIGKGPNMTRYHFDNCIK